MMWVVVTRINGSQHIKNYWLNLGLVRGLEEQRSSGGQFMYTVAYFGNDEVIRFEETIKEMMDTRN